MLLAKNIQVYVKTTGTCNLDCSHCFTSGSKGKNIFFDPDKTAHFLSDLCASQQVKSVRLLYHGGEPMIAPLRDLYRFHELTEKCLPNPEYGIQTNLVYTLTDNKREFFKNIISTRGIGTSWDSSIRFGSSNPSRKIADELLWQKNVRTLVGDGHELTLMVCISNELINNYQPADVINYAIDLGFKYILFERITSDGNASLGDVLPKNLELDQWLLRMYEQTIEQKLYFDIGNMFLEELALAFRRGQYTANRCRGCEQKLITINADGTLAGCPNSATDDIWSHMTSGAPTFLSSEKRLNAICSEKLRPSFCLSCDLNDICNGDCYKLKWDEDVCSAPKSLFRRFKAENNIENVDLLLI
jgi:radical SAM protein with 4Fe4S-binding SPASM domain